MLFPSVCVHEWKGFGLIEASFLLLCEFWGAPSNWLSFGTPFTQANWLRFWALILPLYSQNFGQVPQRTTENFNASVCFSFLSAGGVLKRNQQAFGLRPCVSKCRAARRKLAYAHVLTTLASSLLQKSMSQALLGVKHILSYSCNETQPIKIYCFG